MDSNSILSQQILFTPPVSGFEPTFWETLYHKKLNDFRLDTSPVSIRAELILADNREQGNVKFSSESFQKSFSKQQLTVTGKLINVNKIEEFQAFDKKELIAQEGHRILGDMAKGNAIRNPSLLNQFALLSFADLKSYKFIFWFAQPVLSLKEGVHCQTPLSPISASENPDFLRTIYSFVAQRAKDGEEIPTVFAVRDRFAASSASQVDASTRPVPDFGFGEDAVDESGIRPQENLANDRWEAMSLFDAWPYRYDSSSLRFVILDQSHQEQALGWTTRNFFTLLALFGKQDRSSYFLSSLFFTEWQQHVLDHQEREDGNETPEESNASNSSIPPSKNTVQIVALRNPLLRKLMNSNQTEWNVESLVNHDTSVTAKVEVPALDCPKNFDANGRIDVPLLASSLFPVDNASSSIVGWEPNERGKAGPRIADLRASLDTRVLMTQAVDLNLRLMKWRQWPELQLEKLRNQRCLLMGSGTLGCAVARALMGWGIRHITFVDNGRVAYSNPVRQSLFAYEDAKQGKFKAVAAAEQVMRIFPDMTATAELLAIPMPGHAYRVTHEAASSATDCLTDELARARLDQLVQNHDVVFNLTDSREARWFPTLLASTYGKPCINAALGFDSYVVSHNGITSADGAGVGCYFCTDIVAAGNSQRDRTLDEQCTVTRPGLSFIAGALCAELLVALLHDTETTASKGAVLANEDSDATDIHYESSASSVPHQIRGSVLGFAQMCLESSKFPFCTACSSSIVDAYRESPAEFVAHVSQDPKHLETLSGISEMVRDIDVHLCIDSDEDF